jgi:hypothetical protein
MGLLDRFRAQPRWKNASPAVRTAAVEELPLDQQDTLAWVAREDRDPGVRIAALKKVIDPATIAAIGQSDPDARVRDEAVTLLVDLAVGAFEGTTEAEGLSALGGLTDAKHLVAVARGAASEGVARAALARLFDEGSLGAVARKAGQAPIRLEALRRIATPGELAAVAVRSEFKDVAIAAVGRLSDRGLLEDVASRAKNRTAAKQARALARQLDVDAAAPAAVREDPEQSAARRRRLAAVALCERLEALPANPLDEGDAILDEVDRDWLGLGELAEPELSARFQSARESARLALAQQAAERVERARAIRASADAAAARRALCEQVDASAGDDTPALLETVRTAWAALPPIADGGEAARWQQRFADACRGADARHRVRLQQRAIGARAERACADLERFAGMTAGQPGASPAEPADRARIQAARRAWQELVAAGLDDAGLLARGGAADERLRAREAEARERRAREQQENLARLQALCTDLETLAAAATLTLKQGERGLRDARAALDGIGHLPTRQDHEQVADRLKRVVTSLVPRVQELRDLDEWQRWANAGLQEELCQRVEALLTVEDLAAAAKQLREAQTQWKQVATAPREQSQALWLRFKAASDAVRARCDVYFVQVAEAQAANRARKQALCEQAEALSGSNNWITAAEAIKTLQAEWKAAGAAPRADEKALWDRFHAACDLFFTRRREDLQKRKEEWAANLARKETLCQQAESLAETTEWQKGLDEVKRLQAEWKTVGPVRKNRAEQVWQRFRAACDAFFERYQQRDHLASSSSVAAAEAACEALEQLVSVPGGAGPDGPEGLLEQVNDSRKRFADVVSRLPRDRGIRLGDRLHHALARVVETWPARFAGTDLDPGVHLAKMEALCLQVEHLLAPETPSAEPGAPPAAAEPESPATLLARQLREALASNTIAGRQDDAARWKATIEQVRAAQAAWKGVGPVPEASGRALQARFQRACARVSEKMDQQRRAPGPR